MGCLIYKLGAASVYSVTIINDCRNIHVQKHLPIYCHIILFNLKYPRM